MPQWEYEVLDLNELPKRTSLLDVLNDAGSRGWELVSISSLNIAVLKRQIAPPPPETRKTRQKQG
jgi:hypothetical protein